MASLKVWGSVPHRVCQPAITAGAQGKSGMGMWSGSYHTGLESVLL